MGAVLPSRLAFVVRYRGDTDPQRGHITGLVEHIASGRRARFGSQEELNEFIARIIAEQAKAPEREPHA